MQQGKAEYRIHVNPADVPQSVVLTPGNADSVTDLEQEKVGVAITEIDIVASGGAAPYTFTVIGDLPPGLDVTVSDDTFRLSGTPTAQGDFDFTVNAADSSSAPAATKASFRKAVKK